MKVVVVGSRDLTDVQRATASVLVGMIVGSYVEEDEEVVFGSGEAEGIDTMCRGWADVYGFSFSPFEPTTKRWVGEGGYQERNIKMAQWCDVLWSIRSIQSQTYGSGWTADYAEGISKPVHRLLLP